MNIAIIGAGPVGCYAGYLLAKSGHHQVSIYEQKSQLGIPIQCTGLLTSDFNQFNLDLTSSLVNTFSSLTVNSPSQQLKLQQTEYLVCRQKFDNYLADLAKEAGVKMYLNHHFLRKENDYLVIKNRFTNNQPTNNLPTLIQIKPDVVIAADGPLSPVAKAYGFYHPERKNYVGIQTIIKGNFAPQEYQTFFGKESCPDLFAWIVPESDKLARVGLASIKNTRFYFNNFIKKNNFQVQEITSGIIPFYHPQQQLQKDNCYLLGDAAGFVKATTLGGIIPGMKQAEILADCLNNHKNYSQQIKPLTRKLKIHLRLRTIFNKFSNQDWDKLLKLVNQPKVQSIFRTHTRDNPFPLVTKALLKEPRFLYFAKYLLYSKLR